nr:MAG TPA: metallo-hydrolase-like protein [Caudoviricetes sp.]
MDKGGKNPFIDASEWERFLAECAAHMEQLISCGK